MMVAGVETTAERYDAWYRTSRGRWIAATECALMLRLLQAQPGASLLDVGSGTGRFSRCFAQAGVNVVSLDPAADMLTVARRRSPKLPAVRGTALALPFRDAVFDYAAAVTSLCFIEPPARALAELWRISRRGVILGLLNRGSLLYRLKHDRGAYRGARWDRLDDVRRWCAALEPQPHLQAAFGVFSPGGGWLARRLEARLPAALPWGGFLAVALHRTQID